VGEDVIRIGQTHGQEDGSRIGGGDGGGQHRGHIGRPRPLVLGQVLVIGELKPDRDGGQKVHRRLVLLAPEGDNVVAGHKAPAGVPVGRLRWVGRRSTAENGDHGAARVGAEEMGGAESGVVEMG
jgi:hypothetical protein